MVIFNNSTMLKTSNCYYFRVYSLTVTDLNHLNILFTLIWLLILSPSASQQYLAIRHEGNKQLFNTCVLSKWKDQVIFSILTW